MGFKFKYPFELMRFLSGCLDSLMTQICKIRPVIISEIIFIF